VTSQVQQVATAGTTPFQVELDGCTFPSNIGGPYTAAIRFTYQAEGGDISNSLGLGQSPSIGLRAQILTSNMTPIPSNSDVRLNIPNAGGVFTVQLFARYLKRGVGAINPGLYRGDVIMMLGYL
jgi:type 1 fimbria pilin